MLAPDPIPTAARPIKVSVIICAWNAESCIARAIESALIQEGVSLEIIVVDDHSSDGTFDVAQRFSERHPCVLALRLDRNVGPAGARNVAIDRATGDWIALLDADDTFAPGRLAVLLDVAAQWKAELAADNLWLVDGRSGRPFDLMLQRHRLASPRLVTAISFVQNNMPIDVKRKYGLLKPIVRRDFIEAHGLRYNLDVHYGEDFLFYLECLIKGGRFVLCPEAGYFYALSRESMTRTRAIKDAEAFLDHCDRLLHRQDIASVPGLVRTLTHRSFQLRSDLVYLKCVTSVKKGQIIDALKLFFAHPDVTPFMLLHFNRAVALRLQQLVAGYVGQRH